MDKALLVRRSGLGVQDNHQEKGNAIRNKLGSAETSWSTSECLARIDAADGAIGAILALDRHAAFAAEASAQRWQQGAPLSQVDGMPILVKANIAVAGLPWSAGIGAFRERIATEDASCVARLRAAGAVILGLANMDEGALGASTDNPWFGRTDNPAAPGFSAGGSSGGSAAAVAANFCVAALGTDTIGSVRIPAGYCGVVGHKPGFGSIPVEGVIALAPSLDTVGVFASSAALCAMVATIASGRLLQPPPEHGGRRLAVLDASDWPDLSPEVREAFARTVDAARARGLSIEPVALVPDRLARLQKLLFMLAEIEGAAVHRDALAHHPEGFSLGFRTMLEWGAQAGPARLAAIRAEIAEIGGMLRAALSETDALMLPTTTTPAFDAAGPAPTDQGILVALASALGWPGTAFPMNHGGALPVSAQIVSCEEALCLHLADVLGPPGQG